MTEKVKDIDYVVCRVCRKKFKRITGRHLKTHDMTFDDYVKKYPTAITISSKSSDMTSISGTGRVNTPETIRKMEESADKRWESDEERRLASIRNKEVANRPENKERSRITSIKNWRDPVIRQKMTDGIIESWNKPGHRELISNIMTELQKDGGFGTGYKHTPESIQKISDRFSGVLKTPEHCQHISDTHPDAKGDKNPNWKGGLSSDRHLFMSSIEYKQYHTLVFKRDDYTCQECGKRGGNLHLHHTLPYRDYPDPQYSLNLDNGLTLCEECHKLTFGKEYDFVAKYLGIIFDNKGIEIFG